MANNKIYSDYLMHGRTKGSKNGVSTTPGYIAKGKKAVGQLINGVYVYANNAVNTNYRVDKLAKQAEQRARLMNEANASYKKQQMLNSGNPANNWQQQGNYYRARSEYLDKKNAKKAQQEHAHQNAVNQRNAEQMGRNQALENARKASARNDKAKAIAKGAQNNWQQKANKTTGILGGMTREDRSAAQKIEPYKVNDPFSVAEYSQHGVNRRRDFNNVMEYGNSYVRNRRSDIGNAIADAKVDAKKAFKEAKADAKQAFVNLKSKVKKKKKSLKNFFK